MPALIDTNLIIRFFVEDDQKKADAVERLLKRPHEDLILLDIAFAEIVWVLQSFYGLSKQEISEKLSPLLEIDSLAVNRKILQKTLQYFTNSQLNFIDAYQLAYAEGENLDGIYSYDEGFDKFKTVKRLIP